jgi:hypothetical protein
MIDSLFRGEKYTSEELNARLKFFIGLILGFTLFGIVFVVLYSLIFVTQPMNGMSPVDNKFFELIIPIATFLTGTLSGIMLAGDDKDLRAKAIEASTKSAPPPASPPPGSAFSKPTSFSSTSSFASPIAAAGVGAVGGFAAATTMPAASGLSANSPVPQPPMPEI